MVCKVTNTKPNTKQLLTQQKSFLHQICSLITAPHSILHYRKPLHTSHPPHPKKKHTPGFGVDFSWFIGPSCSLHSLTKKNPWGNSKLPAGFHLHLRSPSVRCFLLRLAFAVRSTGGCLFLCSSHTAWWTGRVSLQCGPGQVFLRTPQFWWRKLRLIKIHDRSKNCLWNIGKSIFEDVDGFARCNIQSFNSVFV